MNSSQPIKLAVILYLLLGKHIGHMSAGLSAVFWGFFCVISQSLQVTAGTQPQLGYEWLLNSYRSNVELNSRPPLHCTRSIVELKIARYFTVVYFGFSSSLVI